MPPNAGWRASCAIPNKITPGRCIRVKGCLKSFRRQRRNRLRRRCAAARLWRGDGSAERNLLREDRGDESGDSHYQQRDKRGVYAIQQPAAYCRQELVEERLSGLRTKKLLESQQDL